jgi:hypothetical protein
MYIMEEERTCGKAYSNLKNLGGNLNIPEINILGIERWPESVEAIINSLKDKDMLLFFCSSSLDNIRGKISEIMDTRILGNLA